jgi:hypothetical protein
MIFDTVRQVEQSPHLPPCKKRAIDNLTFRLKVETVTRHLQALKPSLTQAR